MRDAVVGDAQLLHRLQERRLRAGRRAVDFVGEQKIREDRPRPELECPRVFAKHRRAGDVDGEQVGGHLHPAVIEAEGGGDRPHEQRLGDPRGTFQQHVTAAEQGRQGEIHDFVLPVDDLGDFLADGFVVCF